MAAHIIADFRRIDEQRDLARLRHDRERERHRIVRDIATPDVEQPTDRVRRCQDRRILAALAQACLHIANLVTGCASRQRLRMRADRTFRRQRPLAAPDRVDQVLCQRLDSHALAGQRVFERLDLSDGVQPGIKADHRPLANHPRQPIIRIVLRDLKDIEDCNIGLVGRLRGVAPVHEQRGFCRCHDRAPGGTGKSRQPPQPIRRRRYVFPLMLVSARNQHRVNAEIRHAPPQPRHAVGRETGTFGSVEGLEHPSVLIGRSGSRPQRRNIAPHQL